eukprot:403369557
MKQRFGKINQNYSQQFDFFLYSFDQFISLGLLLAATILITQIQAADTNQTVVVKYRRNLTDGSSCVYSHQCASTCCDLGFDSDETLGSYCFYSGYCTSALKNPGQSCGVSNECESKCCEDTICQKNSICFNKYVLPFVIVFGVLVLFLIAAIVILVLYKRKMRRAKMMKGIDQKAKRMLAALSAKVPQQNKKTVGQDNVQDADIQQSKNNPILKNGLTPHDENKVEIGPSEGIGMNEEVDDQNNLTTPGMKLAADEQDGLITKDHKGNTLALDSHRGSVRSNEDDLNNNVTAAHIIEHVEDDDDDENINQAHNSNQATGMNQMDDNNDGDQQQIDNIGSHTSPNKQHPNEDPLMDQAD